MDRVLTTTFYFEVDLCLQIHFLPYGKAGEQRKRYTFGDILTAPLSYSNNSDRFLTELVDIFRTDYYYGVTDQGFDEAVAQREYLKALFESTFDNEVAISNSPISGEVLRVLLERAEWIRALDGLIVFTTIGSLILIPAKLALRGLGDGVKDGLHYRVRRWFGVPDSWKPEAEPGALKEKSQERIIRGSLEPRKSEMVESKDPEEEA
jgi:hypothetical protein